MTTKAPGTKKFPNQSLKKAVENIAKIHIKYQQSSIPRASAAVCLGYSTLNGTSTKVVANLNSYGLLANQPGGEVQATDLAKDILFWESKEELAESLRKAANEPAVFKKLMSKFGPEVRATDALQRFLEKEGYSSNAATHATKSYVETYEFIDSNYTFDKGTEKDLKNVAESKADLSNREEQNPTDVPLASVSGEFKDWIRVELLGTQIRILTVGGVLDEAMQDMLVEHLKQKRELEKKYKGSMKESQ